MKAQPDNESFQIPPQMPPLTDFYNNPPATSHLCPWRGGVDRIHLAMQISWPDFIVLRSRLQSTKDSAGKKGSTRHHGVDQVQLGKYLVRVSPTGTRIGSKGPYFAFNIDFDGIVILIQARCAPNGECPNVLVTIGGMACLERGDFGALALAYDLIRQMGGEIEHVALSRIDFCLDMPDVGMGEFADAAKDGRYVTRSRCFHDLEQYSRTLRFGRPPVELEVYDKGSEVRSKHDPRLIALMLDRRWGGSVMPAQAVRVEFRIWREKLREYGIESPEDFYRKRRALVDYLCCDWFRFTAGTVDRANTTRAATMPLWEQVHAAFAYWAGQPNGEVLAPLPKGPVNVDHLLKQSYGITKAIGRAQTKEVIGYEAHCDLVLKEALL